MSRLVVFVLCAVLASLFANALATVQASVKKADPAEEPQDGPITVTPSGAMKGSWMETRRGRRFEAYRGIRYAEPPTGELRFQPPKPILKHTTDVDATRDGPACPQLTAHSYHVDEDCLTINVYTPDNKSKTPLPVILFIHPGGLYSLSSRSDQAGPQYLLDKDVVLVTFNYRLGSLGFLSTGDEYAPGNNGFKDQVAALRWVQRNIAAFGGDPKKVTLAGSSCGAMGVLLHMVSPMSKGLFHRAIAMSGYSVSVEPLPKHQRRLAIKQAELLKCPTNSTKEIVECLKTKPWDDFRNWWGFYEFGFDPIHIFEPVVEKDFGQERFLPIQPIDAIRQGKFHSVPLIISQTEDEFFWRAYTITGSERLRKQMNTEWERIAPISFMLPREGAAPKVNKIKDYYFGGKPISDDEASTKALGRLYADSSIGFPVHRTATLMSLHSTKPVYYYEFSYIGNHSHYQDPATGKPIAAAHQDDLIYLFSLSYQFPDISTASPDSPMVDKMTNIWYNFAKDGEPGRDWPALKPDDRKYLRIANKFTVDKNLYEDRFKFWEELYPIIY